MRSACSLSSWWEPCTCVFAHIQQPSYWMKFAKMMWKLHSCFVGSSGWTARFGIFSFLVPSTLNRQLLKPEIVPCRFNVSCRFNVRPFSCCRFNVRLCRFNVAILKPLKFTAVSSQKQFKRWGSIFLGALFRCLKGIICVTSNKFEKLQLIFEVLFKAVFL